MPNSKKNTLGGGIIPENVATLASDSHDDLFVLDWNEGRKVERSAPANCDYGGAAITHNPAFPREIYCFAVAVVWYLN